MKKSELRNIIKEEIIKELAFPTSSIKVSKAKDQNPTIEDFKIIIAKIQTELKKIPGLFNKYHTQYPTSSPNYEVEIILNSDKINNGYYHIKDLIKHIKSPLFNVEYFGK